MGAYNPVFERLVESASDDRSRVTGMIAYGIYKTAKREWTEDIRTRHGRAPTAEELEAYIAVWTPSQLENLRRNAAQVLSEYASEVIEAEEPRILRDALKGSFWRSVWPSMLASLLYTLTLVGLAIVLARAGVDLIGIFRSAAG